MQSNRVSLAGRAGAGRALAALVMVLLAALLLGGAASVRAQPAPANPPTDQLIVQFNPAADPSAQRVVDLLQLMERLNAAAGTELTLERPMSGNAYVFSLEQALPEAEVARIAAALSALPEVAYAEPDRILLPSGRVMAAPPGAMNRLLRTGAMNGPLAADETTPDDTRYDEQWHYRYEAGDSEGVNLPRAWDITTGSAGVVVAVIDTGIRPHVDLAGRTVGGYDFIADPFVSRDGGGRDPDPTDPGDYSGANECYPGSPAFKSSWHGTHVAGTVGAASNNNQGVAGVNWAARIQPVRVLGRCGGYTSDVIDGSRWAAGLSVPGAPANANPARVLNLSLGGFGSCSTTMQNAFNAIASAGAVVAVAAGNSADDASNYSPANCSKVITVASTNREGNMAYYSNFGSAVEIAAPGGETLFGSAGGVLSTLNAGTTTPGADNYVFYQGTSMATPHVAGVAALLLGLRPGLTPAEATDVLMNTARDFPEFSSCTGLCGAGILDAYRALSGGDTELTPPELLSPPDGGDPLTTATPDFSWSAVDGATSYDWQVADENTFAAPLVDANVTDTSATPDAPLADGDYFWRVRARAGDAVSDWSAVWTFSVAVPACEPPGTVVLLAPGDGETLGTPRPVLEWSAADGATVYELVVMDGAGNPVIEVETVSTSYTPDEDLPNGGYSWMVRGRNRTETCDEPGEWSDPWTFVIEQEATEATVYLPMIARP